MGLELVLWDVEFVEIVGICYWVKLDHNKVIKKSGFRWILDCHGLFFCYLFVG